MIPLVRELPATSTSLAPGAPSASVPGTIFVLGPYGGVVAEPRAGATVSFGRNLPEVDVGIGAEDDRISRRHGILTCTGGRWRLRNLGRFPLRLPGAVMVFAETDPVELSEGYTPIFLRSPSGHEHLLEVRITARAALAPARPAAQTNVAARWSLSADERLVLTVLGQRYLRHEEHPQPLSWRQVADELAELFPGGGWTAKRAEHIGVAVRKRLSVAGVPGLTRDEVGDPVGNALNHNMVLELVSTAVLVPPDLRILEDLDI
jgi:hypothetical protein